MILTVRFNDEVNFKLVRWNQYEFRDNLTLVLQTIDLQTVKNVCSHLTKVEIFNDETQVAIFTSFDTFESINYLGTVFVEHEQIFADALSVTLSKVNIVEQVKRLDEQINPIIDVESMTLNEFKDYRLGQVSKECTASIYSGDLVTLSDGSAEHFSFTDKDQADLQSLSSIAMMDPTIELTWHSDGSLCRFYSGVDIILIYQTLNMKLFREVTICNAINLLIKNATTKEEVNSYYWGCELPEETQQRVGQLITKMSGIVQELLSKFIPVNPSPVTPTEPTDEDDENTDENNNDNDENIDDTTDPEEIINE